MLVQSLSACTVQLYLYSPYWPYSLYRASVPVQYSYTSTPSVPVQYSYTSTPSVPVQYSYTSTPSVPVQYSYTSTPSVHVQYSYTSTHPKGLRGLKKKGEAYLSRRPPVLTRPV